MKYQLTIGGKDFEVDAPNEEALPEIADTISQQENLSSNSKPDSKPFQGVQEQNILGQSFNVPGAAARGAVDSFLQGKDISRGYIQGAAQPDQNVPYAERAARLASKAASYLPEPLQAPAAFVGSSVGQLAGAAVDPATYLNPLSAIGLGAQTAIGKAGIEAFAATKPAQEFSKFLNKQRYVKTPIDTKINQVIDEGINKGIRPTVVGKSTETLRNNYKERSRDAVKTIIENKDNLFLTDQEGNQIKRLPQSLDEFSQAIHQTKSSIFKEYDSLLNQAGEEVSATDLTPVISELKNVQKNKVIQIANPQVVKEAKSLQDQLENSRLTLSETQDLIEAYNQQLKSFYKNPNPTDASIAVFKAGVANRLRESLDKTISGVTGKSYQGLKNKYGSLSAIEKDVNHRAIVDARKSSKGFFDLGNILAGGKITEGILTLNAGKIAGGAVEKGLANYYKYLNNPNRSVSSMFNKVEKIYNPRGTTVTPEILRDMPINSQPRLNGPGEIKRLTNQTNLIPPDVGQPRLNGPGEIKRLTNQTNLIPPDVGQPRLNPGQVQYGPELKGEYRGGFGRFTATGISKEAKKKGKKK